MTNNTDTSKKESHSFGLVALALLPVFYLGMFGPIALAHDRLPSPLQSGIWYAYFPLMWVGNHNETVAEGLSAYVDLWKK